ncbi:MAG TPA: ATP-binding protein [Ktedonobacteraceae bacterium]|nr:ATP-binding protein [Ktedonobacteraceae bacterium]
MERLNDIINRTAQRRQQSGNQQEPREQQGQQGQRPNPGQRPAQPLSRRTLPEQTARLGQRRVPSQQAQSQPDQSNQSNQSIPPSRKYYQHASRNRALPEPDYAQRPRYPQREVHETYRPDEMNAAHATRQLYSYEYEQERERQQTARRNDFGADNINNPDHPGSTGYYRTPQRITQTAPQADEYVDASYSVMPQADVQEEWEDDAAAMRYGDWEDDASEQPPYQLQRTTRGNAGDRDHMGMVPATNYPHYPDARDYRDQPSTPRDMPPTQRREREIESHPPGVPYPAVTRNLQAMQVPVPPSRLPASPASPVLPVPPTIQQEMRSHRHTQPLDPQTIANMTREMPQEQRRTPQPIRLPDGQAQTPGIASASASPRNVCPICKGAGYLRANVPFGDPNFGKPVACECKEAERREKRRQQLLELSDLSAFQQSSFTNFHCFPGISPSVKEAYNHAHQFAQDPHGWLVLIGPNGCGKTHLAAAIANQNLKAGAVVLFTVVPDLLAHLRSTFGPNATEAYDQRFAKMREAELLVLDDLGAHQSSSWASEKLFQLLNYRYNSSFPTVITANQQGLMGLDERILSRMSDTALVTKITMVGAIDYRPRNPRRELPR